MKLTHTLLVAALMTPLLPLPAAAQGAAPTGDAAKGAAVARPRPKGYPNVNTYAWAPASPKVISNVRSATRPGCRMS